MVAVAMMEMWIEGEARSGTGGARRDADGARGGRATSDRRSTGIAQGAALVPDLGEHHRAISTRVPDAQAYFDQGLRLVYGFNHDEAARSFAKAAQLDPGVRELLLGPRARAQGPTYNVPMLPDRFPAAWDAVKKAQANAPSATPVEQALIAALAKRYPGAEPKDPAAMQPYNQAYADAMAEVAAKFPDDLDVQVLGAPSR